MESITTPIATTFQKTIHLAQSLELDQLGRFDHDAIISNLPTWGESFVQNVQFSSHNRDALLQSISENKTWLESAIFQKFSLIIYLFFADFPIILTWIILAFIFAIIIVIVASICHVFLKRYRERVAHDAILAIVDGKKEHLEECFACGHYQWVANINLHSIDASDFDPKTTSATGHGKGQSDLVSFWSPTASGYIEIPNPASPGSFLTSSMPHTPLSHDRSVLITAKSRSLTKVERGLLWPQGPSQNTPPSLKQQTLATQLHDAITASHNQFIHIASVGDKDHHGVDNPPFICSRTICRQMNNYDGSLHQSSATSHNTVAVFHLSKDNNKRPNGQHLPLPLPTTHQPNPLARIPPPPAPTLCRDCIEQEQMLLIQRQNAEERWYNYQVRSFLRMFLHKYGRNPTPNSGSNTSGNGDAVAVGNSIKKALKKIRENDQNCHNPNTNNGPCLGKSRSDVTKDIEVQIDTLMEMVEIPLWMLPPPPRDILSFDERNPTQPHPNKAHATAPLCKTCDNKLRAYQNEVIKYNTMVQSRYQPTTASSSLQLSSSSPSRLFPQLSPSPSNSDPNQPSIRNPSLNTSPSGEFDLPLSRQNSHRNANNTNPLAPPTPNTRPNNHHQIPGHSTPPLSRQNSSLLMGPGQGNALRRRLAGGLNQLELHGGQNGPNQFHSTSGRLRLGLPSIPNPSPTLQQSATITTSSPPNHFRQSSALLHSPLHHLPQRQSTTDLRLNTTTALENCHYHEKGRRGSGSGNTASNRLSPSSSISMDELRSMVIETNYQNASHIVEPRIQYETVKNNLRNRSLEMDLIRPVVARVEMVLMIVYHLSIMLINILLEPFVFGLFFFVFPCVRPCSKVMVMLNPNGAKTDSGYVDHTEVETHFHQNALGWIKSFQNDGNDSPYPSYNGNDNDLFMPFEHVNKNVQQQQQHQPQQQSLNFYSKHYSSILSVVENYQNGIYNVENGGENRNGINFDQIDFSHENNYIEEWNTPDSQANDVGLYQPYSARGNRKQNLYTIRDGGRGEMNLRSSSHSTYPQTTTPTAPIKSQRPPLQSTIARMISETFDVCNIPRRVMAKVQRTTMFGALIQLILALFVLGFISVLVSHDVTINHVTSSPLWLRASSAIKAGQEFKGEFVEFQGEWVKSAGLDSSMNTVNTQCSILSLTIISTWEEVVSRGGKFIDQLPQSAQSIILIHRSFPIIPKVASLIMDILSHILNQFLTLTSHLISLGKMVLGFGWDVFNLLLLDTTTKQQQHQSNRPPLPSMEELLTIAQNWDHYQSDSSMGSTIDQIKAQLSTNLTTNLSRYPILDWILSQTDISHLLIHSGGLLVTLFGFKLMTGTIMTVIACLALIVLCILVQKTLHIIELVIRLVYLTIRKAFAIVSWAVRMAKNGFYQIVTKPLTALGNRITLENAKTSVWMPFLLIALFFKKISEFVLMSIVVVFAMILFPIRIGFNFVCTVLGVIINQCSNLFDLVAKWSGKLHTTWYNLTVRAFAQANQSCVQTESFPHQPDGNEISNQALPQPRLSTTTAQQQPHQPQQHQQSKQQFTHQQPQQRTNIGQYRDIDEDSDHTQQPQSQQPNIGTITSRINADPHQYSKGDNNPLNEPLGLNQSFSSLGLGGPSPSTQNGFQNQNIRVGGLALNRHDSRSQSLSKTSSSMGQMGYHQSNYLQQQQQQQPNHFNVSFGREFSIDHQNNNTNINPFISPMNQYQQQQQNQMYQSNLHHGLAPQHTHNHRNNNNNTSMNDGEDENMYNQLYNHQQLPQNTASSDPNHDDALFSLSGLSLVQSNTYMQDDY